MGIRLEVRKSRIEIAKENKDRALTAIKALEKRYDLMSGGQSGSKEDHIYSEPARYAFQNGEPSYWSQKWFSRVDMQKMLSAPTLEECLAEWRWMAVVDSNGNITNLNFEGEKYGDEEILFETLAPYITNGSYIEMTLDFGDEYLRWEFINGQIVKKVGEVVFK